MLVQCVRHLRLWQWEGKPVGLFLVRACVVICVLVIPFQVRTLGASSKTGRWAAMGGERAAVLSQLSSLPEKHLVLVRYKSGHNSLIEWVYNGADIDSQKVLWARDMSPTENAELIHYYQDRRVWLLEADEDPPKLAPYSASTTEPAAIAAAAGK
jgi:hypothetical protein